MGHDRGARVAYRMALDWPDRVSQLVVLDIVTTWDTWQPAHQAAPRKGTHWAFLAQPAPIPETLIGTDPAAWLDGCLERRTRSGSLACFDPRALARYRAILSDADRIHATCEDFRAGASCDLMDDQMDRSALRRIACPTLVLWGTHGGLAMISDPVSLWRPWCETVSGSTVEAGHFIPEESPAELLEAVGPFLNEAEAEACV
ncbi:MAG: alpha/beta fold hydrolase [Hyphomicrobiaceae bacterium]